MDAAVLSAPLATAYPKYHQRLCKVAQQQLASLSRASGLTAQVLALLEQRLGQPEASIEAIAATLNITPRTLQRHLAAESVRFVDLRDQVRHGRACMLLRDSDLAFAAIAEQLGFADVANFYHAFRRWEGCAPGSIGAARRMGDLGHEWQSLASNCIRHVDCAGWIVADAPCSGWRRDPLV